MKRITLNLDICCLFTVDSQGSGSFKGTVLEITLHLKAARLIHKVFLKLLSDQLYEEYRRFPCIKCLILTIFTIISA